MHDKVSYMKSELHIQLTLPEADAARLRALQTAFADVCNVLAEVAQQTRCWNRVTLHHLMYHKLRERFPRLGAQMVCNVIYSVSRTCRAVYQDPASRWNLDTNPAGAPLPRVFFMPNSPVYFDRHTLSLKDGKLSMYTLDGRIRFHIGLQPADEKCFHEEKLREVILKREGERFELVFRFALADDEQAGTGAAEDWPEYTLVSPVEGPAATDEAAAA